MLLARKLGLLILLTASCAPKRGADEGALKTDSETPAECVGGEFAVKGKNKMPTPECLDVIHYPVIRHFSKADEYQAIAQRFKMDGALTMIKAQGVEAARKGYQLVANLKHADRLWIAQIPTQAKATGAIFQVSEFRIPLSKALDVLPADARANLEEMATKNEVVAKELQELKTGHYTAAHGQLRIAYSEPILVVDEKDPEHRTFLKELILSVHAVSPGSAPDTYDPIKGLGNLYGTAMGMFSLDDKVNQAIARHVNAGNPPSLVRQYQVSLTPKQIDDVIQVYLGRAQTVWENYAYNTLTRNCGSEVFEVLDQVIGFTKSKDDLLSTLGRQYPKYAQFGLMKRGLVSLRKGEVAEASGVFRDNQLDHPLPTLNKEMHYPEPE